jgi:uncharacterized protein YdeI (YjbR/CyaY-like superfamily)
MTGKPTFFKTPGAFRAWLQKNHRARTELWVGYWKKRTGRPSITWQESVDEALCFGWIDGIRKSLDAESYTNRFTPRRTGSKWSAVNERRAAELVKAGRMRAAGRQAFQARDPGKTVVYQYELDPELLAMFKANRAAWAFFEAQPPGYRKRLNWRVMSAKQPATRLRRLAEVIDMCAAGRRFEMMPSSRKKA